MLAALMLAAEEEPSKGPFYIAAGVLIVFAVALTAVGVARHETFPPSEGLGRVLTVVCALLVAGTMVTAVITA